MSLPYDAAGLGRCGTPAEQIRERLEISKRAGVPFEISFRAAMERVLWPHERNLRDDAQAMFRDPHHVACWKAAYEDRPGPDLLLGVLATAIEAVPEPSGRLLVLA